MTSGRVCFSLQTKSCWRTLQTVIQRLYFDEELQRTKRGSGGKSAGTPRRLMGFFRQIELNYDLASIKADRFWAMLPREFEKFKQDTAMPSSSPHLASPDQPLHPIRPHA